MILAKAYLSTGLYLHITVANSSIVMIQRKKGTSCLAIISPPTKVGGRYASNCDRDGGDFRLKVDIPNFHGNLNIENFIDWIADKHKFFDYIGVLEEKKVRLVACRLKGSASAWWERLQNRRIREGKHPVRT